MPSKLDQLKSMTTIVADTGDIDSIKAFHPTDCMPRISVATTKPRPIPKRKSSGRIIYRPAMLSPAIGKIISG